MGKTDSFEGDPNDKTGQIRYIRESLDKKADGKTVKFWIGFMGLVAGGAWLAATFFGGFAKNDDLSKAIDKTNVRIDGALERVGRMESAQAVQGAVSTRIEEDLHWLRRQEAENAKATGAQQIPQPQHEEKKR